MTEANQNFSKVAKLVGENGTAVILKNNVPRYIVIEYSKVQEDESADDQLVEDAAKQILSKHSKNIFWRNAIATLHFASRRKAIATLLLFILP